MVNTRLALRDSEKGSDLSGRTVADTHIEKAIKASFSDLCRVSVLGVCVMGKSMMHFVPAKPIRTIGIPE